MKLWELSDTQIDALEKSEAGIYFDILSPISGTVTHRDVAIGDYVKEGSPLFEVTDLSKVWILFDAYESDLPWVKKGDSIRFTLASMPGMQHQAKVSYIDPLIDAKTRVASVRVEMENNEMQFKPEMFVSGILQSKAAVGQEQLLIPKTAVLWTGKRAVVYVRVPQRETPTFIYREIVLGPESGAYYVVAQGLSLGEEIAANGVFKIDASAQLLGKASMMNPQAEKMPLAHQHGETNASEGKKKGVMEVYPSFVKETPTAFKQQLADLLSAYLKMKNAFVLTDAQMAEKEAVNVQNALEKVDMKLLKGDAHLAWMEILNPLKENLMGIIQMDGVEMKRSHFSVVSNQLTRALEQFGTVGSDNLYLEFCPMAFDDEGAFWISEQKEIRNPYFGDKMMKCGVVKKEYESK